MRETSTVAIVPARAIQWLSTVFRPLYDGHTTEFTTRCGGDGITRPNLLLTYRVDGLTYPPGPCPKLKESEGDKGM